MQFAIQWQIPIDILLLLLLIGGSSWTRAGPRGKSKCM